MKVYKTSITSLPIPGCRECPNRVSKRFKHNQRYYGEWVCAAITYKTQNPITRETVFSHRFPSVAEAMRHNTHHHECPLEDYKPQGDTK